MIAKLKGVTINADELEIELEPGNIPQALMRQLGRTDVGGIKDGILGGVQNIRASIDERVAQAGERQTQ